MARMPGAIWRPLAANWASMPRIKSHDIFCLHTMVGSLDGTDGYFRVGNGAGYTGTESHFGVGPDGTIYQWQDTDYQADANYQGGHRVISSENADIGTSFPAWTGTDVPAFTPAQVEANAQIAAFLYDEHGIPLDLILDSLPGRRGMGWHRLGVPGFVVPGGELWSTKAGKVCPGDRRIAQVPAISLRAKQLIGAVPTPAPAPQEDIIASIQDLEATFEKYEESYATRARQKIAAEGPYSLDKLRRIAEGQTATLAQLLKMVASADASDSPEALALALAPLLVDPVVEAVAAKVSGSVAVTDEDKAAIADEVLNQLTARLSA